MNPDRHRPAGSRQGLLLDLGLVASLLLLGVVGWRCFRELDATIEADRRTTQMYQRLQQWDRLLSALRDAETGQRGYLLIGEESYLAPYQAALGAVATDLASLQQLTRDTPAQQQRLAALQPLIEAKLAELKETIEVRRRQGLEASLRILATGKGKRLMEEIRRLVAEAEAQAQQLLQSESTVKAERTRSTLRAFLAGGGLGFLLLAGVFVFLKRENARRRRAETDLRRANAYNRSLLEASLDPLVTIGPDGKITDVNAATETATGCARAALLGTDFSDYFTEPVKARAGYQQVFREGLVRDYPLELRHREGRLTSVLYNASVYRDGSGQVAGIFAAARDITERKRAEEAVSRANAYNRSLLEASLDPLVTIGPDGKLTDVNAAAETATGCARAALLGTDFSDYFTQPEKARAGYQQVFREGLVRDYPLELRHRSGQITPVLYNASVYRDGSGQVAGIFAAARDITARKRAEAEVQRYTEDLRRSNQELEHFAYVASHDLQEPLRTVSSFSQLLSRRYQGKLDTDADEFIAFIVEAATRMQTLINDLLDFSRVGTRGNPFAPVPCEELLRTATENLEAAITESGAVITHDPLPTLEADRTQLTQVFQNLFGNAIKFRRPEEAPRIHVSAARQRGGWQLSVRDNGIGVEAQYFDRIFILFQRLHGRDEYPGTGIGLALCKKIVERHGGRMWVDSEPGTGSTFHFTLPDDKPRLYDKTRPTDPAH
jgi:two-component system, chemotaxis family, sensor kinase Cph1